MKRSPQLELLKKKSKSYGGELLKTRMGRAQGRPLATKHTMHLVLRSSKAKGTSSFWLPENKASIKRITARFARKYGVKILSMANVGNHLHFHIKLSNRLAYFKFIRAITSAIAMAVTGTSRWNPLPQRAKFRGRNLKKGPQVSTLDLDAASELALIGGNETLKTKDHFWDYRPFTRVVLGFNAVLRLKDYIEINQLEGFGLPRLQARFCLRQLGPP